ncbi:hypothetical protein FACS1894205_7060 [Alphaproteobacteria bacterium]|nr:hypothetical protein FACS1894205_7060 [Alphaproteobacteria bacterium]
MNGKFLGVVVSSFCLAAFSVCAGPMDDGLTAFRKGDFQSAAVFFRNAAESGDVVGQYNLATMYELGRGVYQDYPKAILWYQKAAEQGYVKAQYNLAALILGGKRGRDAARRRSALA